MVSPCTCVHPYRGVGVIAFALMTGRLPFDDPSIPRLLALVRAGNYEVPAFVSRSGVDLLQRMLTVRPRHRHVDSTRGWLQVNPDHRASIKDVMRHPWLLQHRHDVIMKQYYLQVWVSVRVGLCGCSSDCGVRASKPGSEA